MLEIILCRLGQTENDGTCGCVNLFYAVLLVLQRRFRGVNSDVA
jgi:hypothetical protein